MIKLFISALAFTFLLRFDYSVAFDQQCRATPVCGRALNLFISGRRNETGEWEVSFNAVKDLDKSPNNINLDIKHKIIECDGKQMISIQGLIKDLGIADERLLFHHICGSNVAIINGGKTVKKLNKDEPFNSMAFTNRILGNDELFEVRLDEINKRWNYAWGIGVTSLSPDTIVLPSEMYYRQFAWMMHHNNVYENKRQVFKDYPRDLNKLSVGDRIGVMRSKFGTLHFFVNGIDLGPAISNLPTSVYGVLELWQDGTQATILDSSRRP